MAEVVGANIASDRPGIGAGDAQVYDTSKLEKQISDQIAAERKRQDIQNQMNAEQLAKIDLNGVRGIDQKVVQQKYQDTYNQFRQLQLAQSKGDRQGAIDAQARLDASKADLQSFIGRSKDDNQKQAVQLADIIHNRGNYTPNAVTGMNDLMNTASTDPTYGSKSDISKFVVNPPKVDLNNLFDKNATESTVESPESLKVIGGAKFVNKSQRIQFPIFAKRNELEYTKDQPTEDRMNEVYQNMDATHKSQLQQAITALHPGYELKTPADYLSADYYLSNGNHYNKEDNKQITEKTPRAAGVSINLATAGSGNTPPTINTAVPNGTKVVTSNVGGKQIKQTAPNVETKQSTVVDGLSFPQIKVSIPNSPSLRNAKTGSSIPGSEVKDLYGTQLNVLPVYTSGPNSGNVVPDDDRDKAIANGQASYKLMFHANQGNAVGLSSDGDVVLSKDATPVYIPADNNVVQALILKTAKNNQPAVASKIQQMYMKASQMNQKTSQQPATKKIKSTVKLQF